MSYSEDDLLPISALQHLAFCPRQWALIHLEGAWADNRLTAEGTVMHERAHDNESESRGDLRIARTLRLRSLRLGLVGQADVVEFHKTANPELGMLLPESEGLWQPCIVEYKHGKPKIGHEDEVQLCAQALCLEEMLGVKIAEASFFYGQPRRRTDIAIIEPLRRETAALTDELHRLFEAGVTPDPEYSTRCHSCSLENLCLPKITKQKNGVKDYIKSQLQLSEHDA